jgi:hypothetical protein
MPPNERAPVVGRGSAQSLNLALNNGANPAPAQDREILFHALATQHLQRVRIIELLESIDRKLDVFIDIALEGGRLP